MADDWMDSELERDRLEQEAASAAATAQQTRAALIKEKGRSVLDALTESVQKQVERYQQKTAGDDARTVSFAAKPTGGFSFDKMVFPASHLETSLDHDGVIRAHSTQTLSRESGTQTIDLAINITVHAGALMLSIDGKTATTDEVATRLLKPVLFPR
jgi:hypothetical protein